MVSEFLTPCGRLAVFLFENASNHNAYAPDTLQEGIEARGHLILFYPKFHCEHNLIEFFLGCCKTTCV